MILKVFEIQIEACTVRYPDTYSVSGKEDAHQTREECASLCVPGKNASVLKNRPRYGNIEEQVAVM